jgi:EF-P beta-lysylation protein EpmB
LNSPHRTWQQQLAEAFTDVDALCRHLQLDPSTLPLLPHYPSFPLRVPRAFVACMEPGNPNDPLLRQVLPLQEELTLADGYSDDPVGDLAATISPGVIHKYHGRVLLILTGACAVHCRYCFRRNFPYSQQQLSRDTLLAACSSISANPSINEVIVSGGDPLLLSDDKLGWMLQQLAAIPHVSRIRIHSRVPVVLPARVTEAFIRQLTALQKPVVLVLHSNHAHELSADVAAACHQLRQAGIHVLNQSVLLQGVNDNAAALIALSERLFACGVLPYYLHCLDKANGTHHFAVSETRACSLIEALQQQLPGYLVPKLVKEQAGAAYKLPIYPVTANDLQTNAS